MWRKSGAHSSGVKKRSTTHADIKGSPARSKLSHSKVAARRRKVRLLVASLVVVLLVCIIGALSWVSFSNIFTINTIVVSGNEDVRTAALQSFLLEHTEKPLLGLFSQQSTLLFPQVKLENLLLFEFPKVATVTIEKNITRHEVVVSITERTPYGEWCRDDAGARDCYILDRDGFIYEKAEEGVPGLFQFESGVKETRRNVLRTSVAPLYFPQVTTFLTELESMQLIPHTVMFQNKDAVVHIEPDWDLKIALDQDLGSVAFNLAALLNEYHLRERLADVEYIDMRFGERVYQKFKAGADSEE